MIRRRRRQVRRKSFRRSKYSIKRSWKRAPRGGKRRSFKRKASQYRKGKRKKKSPRWKSLYKKLMPKAVTLLADANAQVLPDKQYWLAVSPSYGAADIFNMGVDLGAAAARMVTAGTKPVTQFNRILVTGAQTEYFMKVNSLFPVRFKIHTFVVRENIPEVTTVTANTSTIAQIFSDGLFTPQHIDSADATSVDATIPTYEWYHNRWFCQWFKKVGKSREYVLRPQDPAKRFVFKQPRNKCWNGAKMSYSFSYLKGTKFHLIQFMGDMCAMDDVAWTGTGTTQKSGPGPGSVHMLIKEHQEYCALARNDIASYDLSDLRTLKLGITTTLSNVIPSYTPIAGPAYIQSADVVKYVYPTGSAQHYNADNPPKLP